MFTFFKANISQLDFLSVGVRENQVNNSACRQSKKRYCRPALHENKQHCFCFVFLFFIFDAFSFRCMFLTKPGHSSPATAQENNFVTIVWIVVAKRSNFMNVMCKVKILL